MPKPTDLLLICLALAATGAAHADVVHATWGGGSAKVLRETVQESFTKSTGIPVRMVEVPNTAGAVRSPAAKQYSVVDMTFFEGVGMTDLDLLESFTDEELTEAANLPPETVLRNKQGRIVGVSTYFSYYGIAYNSNLASAADFKSWKSLADPKWKGKLSVTRPVYAASYDLTMLAHAAGGSDAKVEPGVPLLKGLINNALTTYTSLAHINTLLGTGEVVAVPMYSTRIWHLNREGVKHLKIAIPEEGALMLSYVAVAPKGGGNRQETIRYLNNLISPDVQVALAVAGGNLPTNRKARLPADYVQTLGISPDELKKRLYVPDWKKVFMHHEERIDLVEQLMAGAGKLKK
ncbi:MAG: extracellular solute-binding protein [Comamonadaceae bacterium]|nr:MAG: extracellular solute-binding protein [Comamonadaceae bacterium]